MRIDEYLRGLSHAQCDHGSGFERALSGDTSEAAQIWSQIASGAADVPEAVTWVWHVAGRIQREVVDSKLLGSDRPRAALSAIGFSGTIDRHLAAKEILESVVAFFPDVSNRALVEHLQERGHLAGMSHKTALNRVAEWRKQIKK
jgi:hypothetical protein